MAVGIKVLWDCIGYALTAKSVLDAMELLLNQEESIIRRIANAQRVSALQAIEAARKGNYKIHMGVAIGHLRVAYNLLHDAANRKARWYEWLDDLTTGVSSRTYDARDTYEEMVEIASMISKGHRAMGEPPNAKDWADKARRVFREYESLATGIGSNPNIGSGGAVGGGLYAEAADESYVKSLSKHLKAERESLEKLLSA